jgi:N-methylhydantoinase A
MRYSGQSYEVTVPASGFSKQEMEAMGESFHAAHLRRYGHSADNQPLEIVNFRVVGLGVIPKPRLREFAPARSTTAPIESRRTDYFGPGLSLDTPVYRRARLEPGMDVYGPAVIEEKTSTTVLYPGQSAHVDQYLNLEVLLPGTD